MQPCTLVFWRPKNYFNHWTICSWLQVSLNYCRAALFCATSIARPFAPIFNFEEWVTKSPVPFGSFLGKPTLQPFPIWINGLSMVCVPLMLDNPLGTLRIVEAYSFCWWFTWKQSTFKTFAALDHARAPSALDSSRPFEADSWKKLWILDLLPWFLRWMAFEQANLECRCWNKRKDSTCWNIFRWAYCFKTCNFFLSAPSWAQHDR